MTFIPDYNYVLDVMANRKPERLVLYEHNICTSIMETILDLKFAELAGGSTSDINEFFKHYCRFFKEMTYDTVSYEICITQVLPDRGAIMGGRPGPIQNRDDFEAYPWESLAEHYWQVATPRFDALAANMPAGMKAVGGVGNGVFEISEDLVGYEYLGFMMVDDPDLFRDLYIRIGNLMTDIWSEFLKRYSNLYAVCRFGDDLGFKTSTLVSPTTIRDHIIPQYSRVINAIKAAGKPFLLHSCGCIFDIMDDLIEIGIDAKHSNEDAIAPFEKWIELYGEKIGLFGGIDLDIVCQKTPAEVLETVLERGRKYRQMANGYAIGSGNSIPAYVPVDGYLAMIEAAQQLRTE